MKKLICVLVMFSLFQSASLNASEKHSEMESSHKHGEEESVEKHDDEASHDDHEGEEEPHDESEGEGHEEAEESSVVGPGKGITEKSKEGMKLSPQALKVMEIQMGPITGKTMEINQKTLVEIKNDKAIYRVRNSWIKRVPVKVLKKNGDKILIEISNFQSGDLLVTSGVGFVRTAELVAEEGAATGHSH